MENREKYKQHFNEILKKFDFEKVNQIMGLVDWKWGFGERGILKVPNTKEMKDMCINLLNCLLDENDFSNEPKEIQSGGFEVIIYPDSQDIDLRFIASDVSWCEELQEVIR